MSHEIAQAGFGAKWPSEKPLGVILALVMAVVSTGAIAFYQYDRDWSFSQQLYLKTYLAAGLSRTLRRASYYTFPVVVDRKIGPRLAETGDVLPVVFANGRPGFALTEWAVRHGALRLESEHGWFKNECLYKMIRHWVFQDQTW